MTRALLAFAFLGLTAACNGDDGTDDDSGSACATEVTTSCADFCASAVATCTGDDEVYADAAACETACAGWDVGCDGDTSGDTLGCRIYHEGAAQGDATTHCPHIADDGGGVCVN